MNINIDQEIQKQDLGDYVVPINEALLEGLNDDVFSSGIPTLDWALEDDDKGGFRDGDLIVISGKSGNGKTLLAQNLIKNMIDRGIPCLLFSYEVIINNIYKSFLKMGVDEKPIIYTPKKNVTGDINWVKEKIIEAEEKHFPKFIVIDHLDFLTAKDIKTSDIRRNEINNIVTDLKRFAIENEKIIVLLAHVVKTRDGNLKNEDIADSRSIANLADMIMFVARKLDDNGDPIGNEGAIKLTKNRISGKYVTIPFYVEEESGRIIPEG